MKIDDNYKQLLEAFSPIIKQSDDFRRSIVPLTKTVTELKQKLNSTVDPNIITSNLTSAIVPLIRTAELTKLGFCSRDIAALVNAGRLERIKQGYYRLSEITENDSEAKLISQLFPDGVICMISALYYYGYSDRTPLTWDIAIDRNSSKARFNIDYPYVTPHYIEKAHLGYGVTEGIYEDCSLKIYDRDRLICECIKFENKIDREIYNKAIIAYIGDPKKDISKLIEYAKRRNIHKKVKNRIGVWL